MILRFDGLIDPEICSLLECHGFDGLYNPNTECACDTYLIRSCDLSAVNCLPGYKVHPRDDTEFLFDIVPDNPKGGEL